MIWTVFGIIVLLANTALLAEMHYIIKKAEKESTNADTILEDIDNRLTALEDKFDYHMKSNNEFSTNQRLDKIEELIDIHG